ncbi:MAG: type II toxin-antitoxin system PrlF family antitoxin [Crocosphaera sp.]|nr:type II toxin-antitoxin system PrlF family antitoxin [Crocosphaera sp.]
MPTATITSKGQTTIPQEIRKLLNLHPGDRLDFLVADDGRVYVQPTNIKVESLKGILHKSNQEIVSIEQMEEAIWWSVQQMKIGKADFSDYLIGQLNAQAGCTETVSFDKKLKGVELFRLL